MAISAANKTSGYDTDGNSSSTTASITPASNKLQLLAISSRTNISTDPNAPTVTGCGLTWVQIATIVYDTTSASRRRLTLFRAMGSSPSSGALTIDFGGQNQTHVTWVADEITGMDTSGTDGSGAIVQSATNKDEVGTTTFTVTLGAFSGSGNATYGAYGEIDATITITPGSGFTELAKATDGGAGNVVTETEFKNSNDTSVDWTLSGTALPGGIAIEIKAAAAPARANFLTLLGAS